MSRRTQIGVLVVSLLVLLGVSYRNWSRSPDIITVSSADEKLQPLKVLDPALRVDLLEKIRKLEYTGTHRNIFSASLPLPPAPKKPEVKMEPPPPPPLPPLETEIHATYFGMESDPKTGRRRAFFTNGEDVFIVREGEILLGRFRVLRIGNNTVEVEEISSGRRATLTMEQLPQQP